ncbi:MAG: hypothetical protein JRI23_18250 [Deltaproteobacteria bacterium]|jgi:hypothetical protein|nr:hypothetical protein [Deltaproteobacteria bacterium]MBW2533797.1 hypothetical protein [Deltaproteobacteria bacterium]
MRAVVQSAKPPTPRKAKRLLRAADVARAKGNDVRAALLRATAATALDSREVEEQLRRDLRQLSQRINTALSLREGLDPEIAGVQWASLLAMLVDEAVRTRRLRYSVEARLLYDLQLAAVAHERPQSAVDLVTWGLSRGRRPVVRPLPATREVRIARRIHAAAKKVRHTRIDTPDRRLLAKMMRWASERADRNVRLALRPEIVRALTTVGLVPRDAPEQLACDKLVEELLDRIVQRGFFSFAHLRDAVSRNQLKLDDLAGGGQWLRGDQLLAADRLLAEVLDGVYRPGEFYLRGLQRLSSLPFGTRIGRALFLFVLLPFGASFVLLEGLAHIVVNPIAGLFGAGPFGLLTLPSFVATAVVLLGLIHLRWLRTAAWKLLTLIGWLLVALFVRIPRWMLRRTLVKRVLRTRLVQATVRRVMVPVLVTAPVVLLTPIGGLPLEWAVGAALATFGVLSVLMTSRVGDFAEGVFFDWFAPRWRTFSTQVLPGMLRLIAELFRRLMDRLERGMYRVDEWLRFRSGQSNLVIAFKATVGLVWAAVAYVTRLYVTLLVEPELNPLKHFPVCTVAHKLMLPLTPAIHVALQHPLAGLGPVISNTFAGVTTFLLPSFFGFLAWELKENWKLYRASRPKALSAATFGPHGETMGRLMIPGVHSGTLPKLYDRLRRAAQREEEAARARGDAARKRPASEGARGSFREGIEEVELAVRRFVEREFVALLARSPLWTGGEVTVTGVHLVSNRVRIQLSCPALGPEPCEIAFEEKGELLLGGVATPGFLADLPAEPSPVRVLLENALAGLYQLAGVDLVREQLRTVLGESTHYEIVRGRLVAWPDHDYRTEAVYRLEGTVLRRRMKPKLKGIMPQHPPPVLDRKEAIFREQTISWQAWTDGWSHPGPELPPRLLPGPSILPPLRPPEPESAPPTTAPARVEVPTSATTRVADTVPADPPAPEESATDEPPTTRAEELDSSPEGGSSGSAQA